MFFYIIILLLYSVLANLFLKTKNIFLLFKYQILEYCAAFVEVWAGWALSNV